MAEHIILTKDFFQYWRGSHIFKTSFALYLTSSIWCTWKRDFFHNMLKIHFATFRCHFCSIMNILLQNVHPFQFRQISLHWDFIWGLRTGEISWMTDLKNTVYLFVTSKKDQWYNQLFVILSWKKLFQLDCVRTWVKSHLCAHLYLRLHGYNLQIL